MHFIIMTLYDTHPFSAVILSTDPHKPLKGRATQSNTTPNNELLCIIKLNFYIRARLKFLGHNEF